MAELNDILNYGNTLNYLGNYTYTAASPTSDTVGDAREIFSNTTRQRERCTVANATKGAGTWVITEIFTIVGNLYLKSTFGQVGTFYDSTTNERGQCILVTADEAILKGNVCSFIQGGTANRLKKTPISGNENDMPCGIALTSASGAGSTFWLAVSGIVQILPETGVTPTLGYVIYTSGANAGTVAQSAAAPAATTHFKEVGHWTETVGINTICKAIIHFN